MSFSRPSSTTEIAVWRHGTLAHTSVLPVGGDHFTNDLAVVLKAPVPDAERLKKKYGAALTALVSEEETVDVPLTGGRGVHPVRRREMAEILQPRAEELLNLLWEEATHEVPAKELRAGLVLTGGGAELDGILEVAEQVLGVPVRKGIPHGLGGLTDVVAGPEWAVAAGLLLYGRASAAAPRSRGKGGKDLLSSLKTKLRGIFSSSAHE